MLVNFIVKLVTMANFMSVLHNQKMGIMPPIWQGCFEDEVDIREIGRAVPVTQQSCNTYSSPSPSSIFSFMGPFLAFPEVATHMETV